jgi:hypothetical protein
MRGQFRIGYLGEGLAKGSNCSSGGFTNLVFLLRSTLAGLLGS